MFSPWKLYQVGQQIRCMRRGEGGMLWWKGGEANITKQYWICHCQKNTPHECFILLFGAGRDRHDHGGGSHHGHEKWAAVLGDNQRGQPHLTWPLVQRKRPRTLSCINVCFMHLMDVVLMDFFLLMHYQWELLSASRLQHRQTGLYHLFPSSVLLSTNANLKIHLQVKFESLSSSLSLR